MRRVKNAILSCFCDLFQVYEWIFFEELDEGFILALELVVAEWKIWENCLLSLLKMNLSL